MVSAGKKMSGAPVVEGRNKKVVGVISERDIMRLIEKRHSDIALELMELE